MRVSEIFYSLQGEGKLVGTPSVFVRLAGCPLRCKWCDTKYAWGTDSGDEMDIDEIIAEVEGWDTGYVVVTGGEPMVQDGLGEMLSRLKKRDKHITVETAGIVYQGGLDCDLMSISPKLSNAGLEQADTSGYKPLDIGVLRKLTADYNYQLKFVIDKPEDGEEVQQVLEQIGDIDKGKVSLMPQARTRRKFIEKAPVVADLCKGTGFRFCNRLQILLWDTQRGV